MKLLLLFLLVSLSACGKSPNIDPAFTSYVLRFLMEETKYDRQAEISFDIQFGPLDSLQAIGMCTPDGVIIRREFWESAIDADKELLMFHELGHCALNLGHVSTASIMHASLISSYYYMSHRQVLIKELFTGIRDIP